MNEPYEPRIKKVEVMSEEFFDMDDAGFIAHGGVNYLETINELLVEMTHSQSDIIQGLAPKMRQHYESFRQRILDLPPELLEIHSELFPADEVPVLLSDACEEWESLGNQLHEVEIDWSSVSIEQFLEAFPSTIYELGQTPESHREIEEKRSPTYDTCDTQDPSLNPEALHSSGHASNILLHTNRPFLLTGITGRKARRLRRAYAQLSDSTAIGIANFVRQAHNACFSYTGRGSLERLSLNLDRAERRVIDMRCPGSGEHYLSDDVEYTSLLRIANIAASSVHKHLY